MVITQTLNPTGMTDEKNPMSQYVRTDYPDLKKEIPRVVHDNAEKRYAAVKEVRNGKTPRFRIVTKTGQRYSFGYAYLLNWHFSPTESILTLHLTTHVIIITGSHLDKIDDLLMDEKIKELYEFNDNDYLPPASNDTVIEEIEISSPWEEEN